MNIYYICMYQTYNPSPNPVLNPVRNPIPNHIPNSSPLQPVPNLSPIPTVLLHKTFKNIAYMCFWGPV